MIGTMVGNYRITELIGAGGMGSVYVGQHPLIGRRVAIKVLHGQLALQPDIVTRFFLEARAVNDIGHENIVDILDFAAPAPERGVDFAYLIMELLSGESLASRLRRGPLPDETIVHITGQMADGLSASHEHGIIHRDIKPDNVFLTARGGDRCFVKLLDFGIAKLHAGPPVLHTQTGALIGTPAYMSPEQCAGHGLIDHRSDIYSLGAVIFEMASGRVPFPRQGFGEVLAAHLAEPAPRLSSVVPGIPPLLDEVVQRCLEKRPEARFGSMDELRAALGFHDSEPRPPRTSPAMPTVIATGPISSPSLSRPPTTLGGASRVLEPRPPVSASASGRARRVTTAMWMGAAAFCTASAFVAQRAIRPHESSAGAVPGGRVVMAADLEALPRVDAGAPLLDLAVAAALVPPASSPVVAAPPITAAPSGRSRTAIRREPIEKGKRTTPPQGSGVVTTPGLPDAPLPGGDERTLPDGPMK